MSIFIQWVDHAGPSGNESLLNGLNALLSCTASWNVLRILRVNKRTNERNNSNTNNNNNNNNNNKSKNTDYSLHSFQFRNRMNRERYRIG